MTSPSQITHLVARLTKAGLQIEQHDVPPRLSAEDKERVSQLKLEAPPAPITKFYEQVNGVTLLWRGSLDGDEVQGSLNILPYRKSAYRAGLDEDSEPLEGILWTDDFEPAARRKLKAMAVFEPVAGRSQFITYEVGVESAALYLVDGDDISPIVPDFETFIELLFRYAGAEGLRPKLTAKDWAEQLRADPILAKIAAL